MVRCAQDGMTTHAFIDQTLFHRLADVTTQQKADTGTGNTDDTGAVVAEIGQSWGWV